MKSITLAIEVAFESALRSLHFDTLPIIALSKSPLHGEYQCNNALALAKIHKKSPRDIAQLLVDAMPDCKYILKLEIAGPGFINIFIAHHVIAQEVLSKEFSENFGVSKNESSKKVIVEYSSPNIAKELHIGHLRSTIIGESLARLEEIKGNNVLRINHVGDWGTQFGMLIAYIEKEYGSIDQMDVTLSLLMQWYRASKKLFDDDNKFKQAAHRRVCDLQQGEIQALKTWHKICDISRSGFLKIYSQLDVTLIERGESFYNKDLQKVVDMCVDAKTAIKDHGAICIFNEDFIGKDGDVLPLIIQKSDGGFNYATTDIAALYQRIHIEKADEILYVVDAGQKLHFSMVFAAAKNSNIIPENSKIMHIPFGVVLGEDGKKLKTRSGETVKLQDVIDTAIAKAGDVLKDRNIDDTDRLEMSKTLGISALKYADLSSHREKDYTYSVERMLQFEGNTATFIMYTYVRSLAILRKASYSGSKESSVPMILHLSEKSLLLAMRRFSEAVDEAHALKLPHKITEYAYMLSNAFNAFFRDCPVINSEEEQFRLHIVDQYSHVIKKSLFLLGITPLERM